MSVVTATILSNGVKIDPTWEVLSLDVAKEVNRISSAQIVLLDGDAAKQAFPISDSKMFVPGREIEIKLRYEGELGSDTTVFKGIVVGHRVEAGAQGSLLAVELKDTAIKMTRLRKSAVHRDQTDDEVIGSLIANAGLKKGQLEATKVTHKELVQYYCSDWDFMLSRAEANGLLVVANDGQISLQGIAMQAIAVAGVAKHTVTYGDNMLSFELEADAEQQYGSVESAAWDVKNQKLTAAARAKGLSLAQGNLKAENMAKTIGAGKALFVSPVPLLIQELHAWSDGVMARSRMSMIRGRVAVPGIPHVALMDVVEIKGVGTRFNGKTVVTGLRHRVEGGSWQTDVQFGISGDRFAERPDIVDVPAAGLLPAVHGLQIGIVDSFQEDPDKEFRVRVMLPGLENKGVIWARLASPDGGKERGFFFRPEPGDEVVVGFFNDDPRHAVILGAMYGSHNAPPKRFSKLTKDNFKKAIVTKKGTTIEFDDEKVTVFVQTPGKNKILLDDDKKAVMLSDQHGNTITMDDKGITIKSVKDFKVEASNNVEIKGAKVDVK